MTQIIIGVVFGLLHLGAAYVYFISAKLYPNDKADFSLYIKSLYADIVGILLMIISLGTFTWIRPTDFYCIAPWTVGLVASLGAQIYRILVRNKYLT